MAIKLPSHLHRSRSGTLHFRITIPPDLRHHFASHEIYRSLRTPNVRDATCAVQALSNAFKQAFNEIRQQSMPNSPNMPKTPLRSVSKDNSVFDEDVAAARDKLGAQLLSIINANAKFDGVRGAMVQHLTQMSAYLDRLNQLSKSMSMKSPAPQFARSIISLTRY
jgi:hypothetical protein